MLSGGAGLGKFHYGVIKALWEQDLLPRVICGTSIGSAIGASICVFKRDELPMLFLHEVTLYHGIVQGKFKDYYDLMYKVFYKNDIFLNIDQVKAWARNHLEDLTFKEIYEKNGWILNIGVTDEKMNTQRVCNYLTTPDVVVWSAVCCSCSLTEVFGMQELYVKTSKGNIEPYHTENNEFIDKPINSGLFKYVDGCFSNDLPYERI